MKKIVISIVALGLGVLASAQGNRIVCDETCRIEYKKTDAEASKKVAASSKTAATSKTAAPKTTAAFCRPLRFRRCIL